MSGREVGRGAQSSMGPWGCGLLWSRFGFTLKNFTPGKLQTQQKFIKFRSQKKSEKRTEKDGNTHTEGGEREKERQCKPIA